MAGKVLAIHLEKDAIHGVLINSRLKGIEVIDTYQIPISEGIGPALKELKSRLKESPDTVYLTLGSERASFRNLKLPFKDPKAISKALPFELESLVPFSLEDRLVDFSYAWDGGHSDVLCGILSKVELNEIINQLKEVGLEPDSIDLDVTAVNQYIKETSGRSDYMLVLLKRGGIIVSVAEKGRLKTIRAIELDESSFQDDTNKIYSKILDQLRITLSYYRYAYSPVYNPKETIIISSNGIDFEKLNATLNDTIEATVVDGNFIVSNTIKTEMGIDKTNVIPYASAVVSINSKPFFDFSKYITKKKYALYSALLKTFRPTIILMCLTVFLFGVDQLLSLYALENKFYETDKKLKNIYAQNFGKLPSGVEPVSDAKAKVNELRKRFKDVEFKLSTSLAIDLITDIINRLPEGSFIELDRMVIDAETVQISGTADGYNTVDVFKNELQGSNYVQDVSIQSAKVDKSGKTVNFELRLKRKT